MADALPLSEAPAGAVLQIPVPDAGPGKGVDSPMALDPTIELVLNQCFAEMAKAGTAATERRTASADNVAEQTKILFLEEKMKIGPREAAAQQRLDSDKLASAILQQRSAGGQPQAAGGPQPVKPAA